MTEITRDTYLDWLAQNGRDIRERAEAGNTTAQQIMTLYQMHYDAPGDPGALGVLLAIIESYQSERHDGNREDRGPEGP